MTRCRDWDGMVCVGLDLAQNDVAEVAAGTETWVVAVVVGLGTE